MTPYVEQMRHTVALGSNISTLRPHGSKIHATRFSATSSTTSVQSEISDLRQYLLAPRRLALRLVKLPPPPAFCLCLCRAFCTSCRRTAKLVNDDPPDEGLYLAHYVPAPPPPTSPSPLDDPISSAHHHPAHDLRAPPSTFIFRPSATSTPSKPSPRQSSRSATPRLSVRRLASIAKTSSPTGFLTSPPTCTTIVNNYGPRIPTNESAV